MPCRTQTQPNDHGAKDLHRHHTVEPELTGHGHAVRMRVRDGTELDRLHRAGLIDSNQHSAGFVFARDLYGARLLGMKTTSFSSTGGGATGLSDDQASGLERVADVIRYLDRAVGVGTRIVVVDLCLGTLALKQPAAILAARHGLDALLALYDRRHCPLGSTGMPVDLLI